MWFKNLTVNFSWMCPTVLFWKLQGGHWIGKTVTMSSGCTLWFQHLEENRMIFIYLQNLILITTGEANICFMSLQYSWIWKLYDVCRIHQITKLEVSGELILTNEESNAFLMWINLINVVEESYIYQPLLHKAVSYHKLKHLKKGNRYK